MIVWTTFYRSRVTRPGHVLSKFWLACRFDKLILSRHAFGSGLYAFYRSWVTRQGHVLSMFWLACSFAKVILSRHAFGNDLDNFLQVVRDHARTCSVDVLACL